MWLKFMWHFGKAPAKNVISLYLSPTEDAKNHLMQRANSLEKTLILGKIEGKRKRERQRMR